MSDIWKKADNLEVEYKRVDGSILAVRFIFGLIIFVLIVIFIGYGTVLNHEYTMQNAQPTPYALINVGASKPTATASHTPTMTPSATFTATPTPTNTATSTPTMTPSNTPTDTPTSTPSHTPTMTPTSTATNTPTTTTTATSQPFMAQYSQSIATMQPGANLEPMAWNWQKVILFLAYACFAMAGIVGIVLYGNWQKAKVVTVTNGANRQRTSPTPLVQPAVLRPKENSDARQMIINVNYPHAPQVNIPSNANTPVNQPELPQVQSIESIQPPIQGPIQAQSTAVTGVIVGEVGGIGRGVVMRHNGREYVLPFDETKELDEGQKEFIIAYYQSLPQGIRNLGNTCRTIYGKGNGGGVAYGRIQAVYNEWMIKQGNKE